MSTHLLSYSVMENGDSALTSATADSSSASNIGIRDIATTRLITQNDAIAEQLKNLVAETAVKDSHSVCTSDAHISTDPVLQRIDAVERKIDQQSLMLDEIITLLKSK